MRLGLFNRAYEYAVRTRLANLFTIPVDDLRAVPVAEARRRLGMPVDGVAAAVYRGIVIPAAMADALRHASGEAAWVRFELTKDFRPWRFSRPLP